MITTGLTPVQDWQAPPARPDSRHDLRSAPADQQTRDSVSISNDAKSAFAGEQELDAEQQREVDELRRRDREVRTHENAHKAAAGDLASGGPNYSYETGPDGRRYAVGGEVQIQLREGQTPEQTLANMQRAQRAASAPESPSSQDRSVAAKAAQMAQQARQEIQAERGDESDTDDRTARQIDLLA